MPLSHNEIVSRGRFTGGALCLGVLVALSTSCGGSDDPPSVGSGAGTTGSSGTTGSGGNAPGAGTTGQVPGAGMSSSGASTGGAPSAGGASISAGSGGAAVTAGTGGAPTTAGAGGTSGGASSGGTGGAAGAATGAGDAYVTGVTVTLDPNVNTMLVVNWTQSKAAEQTWLEFTFENGNVLTSEPKPGALGAHREVALGTPGATAVTIRIVSRQGGVDYKTHDYIGMTKAVPTGMPVPTVVTPYDATIGSPDRWMFGAVENSNGGCASTTCYYHTTFWVYIMDRKGRIVWYYADPASNATSSFQRIARDGKYVWIEKRPFGGGSTRSVLKMTLDRTYMQNIPIPNLSDCIDVTTDGALLFDTTGGGTTGGLLREMNRAGTFRTIWNCRTHFGTGFQCYSNTVNWSEADDTVLMSFPDERTVIQINRQTGAVVGQYGAAPNSYAFSPATWGFGFQHFANITKDGTLLVSSHMPGYENTRMPVAGQHAFMEFTIDRPNRRLVEKWVYNSGQEWAMFKGMAIRLPNGNTLANYGTGGAIREITPDKRTAWHIKFDVPTGNDFFNKMVGHNVLIDNLYALNGGGPQ